MDVILKSTIPHLFNFSPYKTCNYKKSHRKCDFQITKNWDMQLKNYRISELQETILFSYMKHLFFKDSNIQSQPDSKTYRTLS